MAAKSSTGDVAAAVVDVVHMVKGQLEGAWEEDIVVAAARNTFVDFAVIAKLVVRTFCVDHVRKGRPQRLENSTGEYDMRSGDKVVATFVRLP